MDSQKSEDTKYFSKQNGIYAVIVVAFLIFITGAIYFRKKKRDRSGLRQPLTNDGD